MIWIWRYDNVSHNWVIWWHIAWIWQCDGRSHEFGDVITHHTNLVMLWNFEWVGDMMTYRVNLVIQRHIAWIWWHDDTSHVFDDIMTHRVSWRYDDISREFDDMLTHRMSLAMWWHMTSIWWCETQSRHVSQFPAYMYKRHNTRTNQLTPSSRIFDERPAVPRLVKTFTAHSATRRFGTMFTRTHQ